MDVLAPVNVNDIFNVHAINKDEGVAVNGFVNPQYQVFIGFVKPQSGGFNDPFVSAFD